MRGGESLRKALLGPQRVIWVSLLVCNRVGRFPGNLEENWERETRVVGSVLLAAVLFLVSSSSECSSSDSTGLNIGEVGGRSEVRSSLMLRCLRIGL